MRTLINNPGVSFRVDGAIHQSAVRRAKSANNLPGQIPFGRTAARFQTASVPSQPLPPEPQAPELPNDDFPFSALIWLVRQMRR
jgi:hypothetical protein